MTFTKVTNTGIGSTGTFLLQNLDVAGVITATSANFSDNVSIAGTLSYEDVTNVDSVGIITARSNILVGSGITLSPDGHAFVAGVSTIGTLSVSGIATVGGVIDSSTGTVTSSGNMTVGDSLTVTRNVNIGTAGKLTISGNAAAKSIEYGDGTTTGYFVSNTNVNRANADSAIHLQQFRWNDTKVAEMKVLTGDDTTNKDNAHITFETASAGTTGERLRIAADGKIGIGTDDPQQILHIHGGANSAILLGNTGHGYKLRANVTSANDYGFLIEDEDGVDLYRATSSTGTNAADTHLWSTAGSERLRIASAGQIGIAGGNYGSDNQALTSQGSSASVEWRGINTPAFDAVQSSAHNVTTATWTLVSNLSEQIDTDGAFASNTFTVPSGGAGTYFIYGYATIDDVQAADIVLCGITINAGSAEPANVRRGSFGTAGTANSRISAVYNGVVNLSVGDEVRLSVYHNEGTTEPTEPYYTKFGGYRLSV